jgi:hypothetical protein
VIEQVHAWDWDKKGVRICATNLANKTKCMSTNAKEWNNFVETCTGDHALGFVG